MPDSFPVNIGERHGWRSQFPAGLSRELGSLTETVCGSPPSFARFVGLLGF